MNHIWGTALFISLATVAWNILAMTLSWFGIFLPVVEVTG
jgi:hypothetical protein